MPPPRRMVWIGLVGLLPLWLVLHDASPAGMQQVEDGWGEVAELHDWSLMALDGSVICDMGQGCPDPEERVASWQGPCRWQGHALLGQGPQLLAWDLGWDDTWIQYNTAQGEDGHAIIDQVPVTSRPGFWLKSIGIVASVEAEVPCDTSIVQATFHWKGNTLLGGGSAPHYAGKIVTYVDPGACWAWEIAIGNC